MYLTYFHNSTDFRVPFALLPKFIHANFRTVLEEHWEESKGYPANKGNDSSMRFSVDPEGCQIVLEEVESLTQHAPHLVPILREEMFQVSVFALFF